MDCFTVLKIKFYPKLELMIQDLVHGSNVIHIVVVWVRGRVMWLVVSSISKEHTISVLNLNLDVACSTGTLTPTGVITQKTTV